MSVITPLFAITATIALGAMSPGPSFVYVAQNAVARSRAHGLVTALGTGVGAAAFSLMALLGLPGFSAGGTGGLYRDQDSRRALSAVAGL